MKTASTTHRPLGDRSSSIRKPSADAPPSQNVPYSASRDQSKKSVGQQSSGRVVGDAKSSPLPVLLDKENVSRNPTTKKSSRLTTLRRTLGGKALALASSSSNIDHETTKSETLVPTKVPLVNKNSNNNNSQQSIQQQQQQEKSTSAAEAATHSAESSFLTRRMNRTLAPPPPPQGSSSSTAIPKTPKTMLRFEMDAVSTSFEDSLLVSPIVNRSMLSTLHMVESTSTLTTPFTMAINRNEPTPTQASVEATMCTPSIETLEDYVLGWSQDIAKLDLYLSGSTTKPNHNTTFDDITPTIANGATSKGFQDGFVEEPNELVSQPQSVLPSQPSTVSSDSTRVALNLQRPPRDTVDQSREIEIETPFETTTSTTASSETPTTRGNGVQMDLSEMFRHATTSPTADRESTAKTIPVVSVVNPRHDLWLDFGRHNMVGKIRSMSFYLEAPPVDSGACVVVVVHIEKVPTKKGFEIEAWDINESNNNESIGEDNNNKRVVHIPQGERKLFQVSWVPKEAGGVREMIMLKLPRGRLQVICHGHAQPAPPVKKSKSSSGNTNHVGSSAKQRLTLSQIKHGGTPQNYSPFVEPRLGKDRDHALAKSLPPIPVSSTASPGAKAVAVFNEEDAAKQCVAFAEWLNYTFQPTEDRDHESNLHETGLQKSDDRLALRTLILHRRAAQARTKALEVFKSQDMQSVKAALESEVSRGRLSIRPDRDLHADLNLRAEVTELLLSYSTPWLRLGLETIFQETISADIPSLLSPRRDDSRTKTRGKAPLGRIKLILKDFIINRVISDDKVLVKYTKGRCKVPSGKFEKDYQAEIKALVLNRLLLLVFFLDRARTANVLTKIPCLFTNESKVKSSREVLVALCRGFLSAEGDIIKHFSRIGLKVNYKQDPMDELDFTVTNLAMDFRDGIRLAKLTEILTAAPPKSILAQTRLPAVSRLQKLHNNEVVLTTLRAFGVPISDAIMPHHVVDGYRDKFLLLMWSIVAHFSLGQLINAPMLEQEIESIRRAKHRRTKAWLRISCSDDLQVESSQDMEQKARNLLLRWCQSICSCFGTRVNDFSKSFADGKAMCLLLHFYHPAALQLSEILPTSGNLTREEAIRNERKNSTLANSVMSELGGIPKMLPITDSVNVPEEKTMLVCLAYLCSRLMESSKEIFSSILIQNYFRRFRRRVEQQEKARAAAILLIYWRNHKERYFETQRRKYGGPVRVIEQFMSQRWHSLVSIRVHRLANERVENAATLVQKHFRRLVVRSSYLTQIERHRAIIALQARWRLFLALRMFSTIRSAVLVIQSCVRCYRSRRRLHSTIASVVSIQAAYRGWRVRRKLNGRYRAAVKIQSLWRCFSAQVQYQIDLLDIVAVQSVARRLLAITFRKRAIASLVLVQCAARRFLATRRADRVRSNLAEERKKLQSLVTIQCLWRVWRDRNLFKIRVGAIITIQSMVRRKHAMTCRVRLQRSAVILQCGGRRWLAAREIERRRFLAMKVRIQLHAIEKIQCLWRGAATRKQYMVAISNVIAIQSVARRKIAVAQLKSCRDAAIAIQKSLRRCIAIRLVRRKRATADFQKMVVLSATKIQAFWRMFSDHSEFLVARDSAIKIQAFFRGSTARQLILVAHRSVTVLQATWRSYIAKKLFGQNVAAVVMMQAVIRRGLAAREARMRKANVIRLQSVFRRLAALSRAKALQVKKQKEAYNQLEKRRLCSMMIQAWFRGHQIRRELKNLQMSAVMLQKHFRRYVARTCYRMDLFDVIITQSVVRKWIACRTFRRKTSVARIVQRLARAWLARKVLSSLRIEKCKVTLEFQSAVRIQSLFRGLSTRLSFRLHVAARKIQKTWRCYTVHLDFAVAYLSIIKIQSIIRCFLSSRVADKLRSAMLSSKAVIIQSAYRGFVARISLYESLWACSEIQRWVRGHLVRLDMKVRSDAATDIQRIFRGYLANVDYIITLRMAIKAQSLVRLWLARRCLNAFRLEQFHQMVNRLFVEKTVATIQRFYRGHLLRCRQRRAAVIIQHAARSFLHNLACDKILRGVTRLQCMIRGQLTRGRCQKSLREACRRVLDANARARANPNLQLGARTKSALDVLRTSTRLVEIMSAVVTLETATQLSEACCVCFVKAEAPQALFALVQTCNRSLPHVELLHFILRALNNVAEHDALLSSVVLPAYADTLIDLLQFHRDQEKVVDLAALLLYRGVRGSRQFRHCCDNDKNLKRLKLSYTLCIRKARSISVNTRCSFTIGCPDKKWKHSVRLLKSAISLLDPEFTVPT